MAPRRGLGFLAIVALVAAGTLGGVAGPASAHNYPVGSTPAAGTTVTEQPGTIVLTTNDTLLDFGNGAAMEVAGPAADPKYYGDGCVRIVDASIEMDAQLGAPGEYTVTWQVVSTDGHPVSDSFTFDWEPAAGVDLAAGSAEPPTCSTAAPGESATSPASDGAGSDAASPAASVADILWIGGALLVVILAAGITLLLVRRRDRRA